MSLEELVAKYIRSTEHALDRMVRTKGSLIVEDKKVDEVLRYVATYLEDAKYYKEQGKLETGLTSVAYCEGLLDALKLIGAVELPASK